MKCPECGSQNLITRDYASRNNYKLQCGSCGYINRHSHFYEINDITNHNSKNKEMDLHDLIEDCWVQFAYSEKDDNGNVIKRHNGGLSTLERIESYLWEKNLIDKNGLFEWDKEVKQ